MLWFAWKIATSGGDTTEDKRRQPIGFVVAAGFQLINPKSWLACTSAAATFVDVSHGAAYVQAATLALLFIVVALPWCFIWLAFGAVLQRVLRSQRSMRAFNPRWLLSWTASIVVLAL